MIRSKPARYAALAIILLCPAISPGVSAELIGGWGEFGDDAGAQFGAVVAPAGDINADGYSDLLVSAPWHDGPGPEYGRIYCYWGSASGMSPVNFWAIEGTQSGAEFGVGLSSAGDINGDGYDDIAIGAPAAGLGAPELGELWVYLGSHYGPATINYHAGGSQPFGRYGEAIAPAGDVNGDGFDDLLVGAPGENSGSGRVWLLRGSPFGIGGVLWSFAPATPAGRAGTVVAGAGDVNADGFADIAIADVLGNVSIFHGSAGGPSAVPDLVLQGDAGIRFGASVAGAGDVNGDGYADLIVGAPEFSDGHAGEGIAYVFHGGPSGLETDPGWSFVGNNDGAQLGSSVATAGDVNGDGYADVALGAPGASIQYTHDGYWAVVLGSPDGLHDGVEAAAHGGQEGCRHGTCVATAGDVNGDGNSDVAIGSPLYDSGLLIDAGNAGVTYFGVDRPSYLPQLNAWGGQEAAREGSAVTLGDFDGDGYADAATGTGLYDLAGQPDAGRVRMFRGGPTGVETTAAWTSLGSAAAQKHGAAIAGNGDVNNDGYEDLLVGAPGDAVDRGRALLFLGGPSGPSAAPDWSAQGEDSGDHYGAAVAFVGDVNGDGRSDAAVAAPDREGAFPGGGKVYLYLGTQDGLTLTPVWTAWGGASGARFGSAIAGAGDVNADGFSDLIVGAPGRDLAAGAAYVYHGSPGGPSPSPDWTFLGQAEGDLFGAAVSSAGDVDADGFSDVVVGLPGWDYSVFPNNGAAWVFRGGAGGLGVSPYGQIFSGNDAQAGTAVGSADLNGDGRSDILVGVPGVDNPQIDEGQVWVCYSTPSGFERVWAADGNIDGAAHGSAIASGRDVTGDGFPDILTGMPGASQTTPAEGWTVIWPGNGHGNEYSPLNNYGHGLDRRPIALQWDGSAPISLLGQSDDPNQILLSAHARTPMGRGRVRIECQLALPGGAFGDLGTVRSLIHDTGSPDPDLGSRVAIEQTLAGLSPGDLYRWRLRILGSGPYWKRSRWYTAPGNGATEVDLRMHPGGADVGPVAGNAIETFRLAVTPTTIIDRTVFSFDVTREQSIELRIHDVSGRCLATLFEGRSPAGRQTLDWSGTDRRGARLPAGVYFAVLRAGGVTRAAPVVIAR